MIAGAGPSGLSTALFLNHLDVECDIIDKKENISPYSKALGVNPNTLRLFEPYGISNQLIEEGRKMHSMTLWYQNDKVFVNSFDIKHKYPFMLMLPQQKTEDILRSHLESKGQKIHYSVTLNDFKFEQDKIKVKTDSSTFDSGSYDYLIGADGASSLVRKRSGLKLQGFTYEAEWELFDIELEGSIDKDSGHIFLYPDGGFIMLRIKDNIWRLAGNLKNLLEYIPIDFVNGKIHWESKFQIHHRVAQKLTKNNIAILGDAAHLHSPMGARGMNMGIEDAFILSQCISTKDLAKFEKRRAFMYKTVNRINTMTSLFAAENKLINPFRNNKALLKIIFPIVAPRMVKFILAI